MPNQSSLYPQPKHDILLTCSSFLPHALGRRSSHPTNFVLLPKAIGFSLSPDNSAGRVYVVFQAGPGIRNCSQCLSEAVIIDSGFYVFRVEYLSFPWKEKTGGPLKWLACSSAFLALAHGDLRACLCLYLRLALNKFAAPLRG